MTSVHDFSAKMLDGRTVPLRDYNGQVLLIVNTASRCGFTPQYRDLENLYQQYRARGFAVLAFPCNQFGQQEPGSSTDIAQFCESNFHISFPLFEKIEVNGANTHPLYGFLKTAKPGLFGTQAIKWNFTKFLIDKQGQPVERYGPMQTPNSLKNAVEHYLAIA
ncbi:MAG: glutathione peroxidase [Methylomonas sp.]|nr:glutathione peroxidase [Methylomonas sp.]PPD21120.1 MAG: glutathione peroxidase [Methylomonas sp.]PPD27554.1 MAG: glutathione peroxidase [Methylomonas sp.]PPD39550.1 MAG: glutathione peroxidase [Methylomonas sp.]PPD55801.1 MAG: glutathione peroxidase [Methylomonas sp.]